MADRDDEASPATEPKRSGQNPWLWTGIVIVVVVAALGVSALVGTDQRDPEVGDADVTAFCSSVASTAAIFRMDASGGDPRANAEALARLADVSPDNIVETVHEVEQATRDLADQLDEIGGADDPTNTSAQDRRFAAVLSFSETNDAVLTRLSTYISKACGADVLAPTYDTTPGAGTGTSPSGVPSPPLLPTVPVTSTSTPTSTSTSPPTPATSSAVVSEPAGG